MSKASPAPRRERVERNIYRRPSGVFEVGFKDGAGVQRWRTVEGGITAARVLRDELLARRGRGERVAPNPRLRFAEAADKYLAGPVRGLRPNTQDLYRNAVERHLRPRYATRRLDALDADDLALLVQDLRGEGLSESSIVIVLGVVKRIFDHADRRLGWAGRNPVLKMSRDERPKPSRSPRRRIFDGAELDQVITAARGHWRVLFTVAAITGARVSELLALTWADVRLADLSDAEIVFAFQVDRYGNRRATKTDESARTVPIPRQLATLLAGHKLACRDKRDVAFVFATGTGRALSQRNVARALRTAQRNAVNQNGRPTFPILHERDERGRPTPVAHGALPSMHSFRHTRASRALLAGESIDEVAFVLGHTNANVTRAVYVREVADARRRENSRAKVAAEYGSALEAAAAPIPPAEDRSDQPRIHELRAAS